MGRRKGSVNKLSEGKLPRGVTCYQDKRARPYLVRHRALKPESFATAEQAVARKNELIALEKREGHSALEYSRDVHADVTEARKILPAEISHAEAARFWVQHHPSIAITVTEAVEQFVELRRSQSIRPDGWTRHTKDLKSRLLRFALAFGGVAMPDVTGERVLEWLATIKSDQGKPIAPRTLANYRTALENLFNYAARRRWVAASPMSGVIQEDLPTVRRARKNPLTITQANLLLEGVEAEAPQFMIHFALRLFLGMRTAESERFRWEWIQRDQGRIIIPGWFMRDDQIMEQGSKTGDDWAIDDVPPRFWAIFDSEPRPLEGYVPRPSSKRWNGKPPSAKNRKPGLKEKLIARMGIPTWPHNATRDTFCTLHMSAYRNAQRTALVMKHRNSQTLWQSYLSQLVPEAEARAFFEA